MNIECSGIEKDCVFEIFLQRKELESTGKIYRLDQVCKALENLSPSFSNTIHSSLHQQHGIDLSTSNFLNNGIVCKVLGPASSGWKSGKLEIRVQIDFIPDFPQEPEGINSQENDGESDLDELRKIV